MDYIFIELTGNNIFDFAFNMVVISYLFGWFWGTVLTTFKRLFR